jgi:hypothetical protein
MLLLLLQILTIGGMIVATFFIYQTFGPRQLSFNFTKREKREWNKLAKDSLGSWLTVCSIFATITSFATVYVFFIGKTREYGWWIVSSVVTIWVGAFITNYFTRILLSRRHIAKRFQSGDQSGAVLLTLVLDGTNKGILSASIVRFVTLTNILAILWLEFSVFADMSANVILPVDGGELASAFVGRNGRILWGAMSLYCCAFAVTYFTLRFGLRGFLFADLFHGAIIVLGTLALLISTVLFLVGGQVDRLAELPGKILTEMTAANTDLVGGLLFAISCVFLNSFLVLVTQPHWFRVWMFGKKETTLQVTSLSITAVVWSMLILIGAFASIVMTDAGIDAEHKATDIDIEVAVYFLQKVMKEAPLFAALFWLAGMGALFSTADAQIYSFFLIQRFNLQEGKSVHAEFSELRRASYSAAAAALFALCYALVHYLDVPFDRLILVLLPSCLNIVPALILAVRGTRQAPSLLLISIVPYAICALLGLLGVARVFAVAAPLMPLMVSGIALLVHRPKKKVTHAT